MKVTSYVEHVSSERGDTCLNFKDVFGPVDNRIKFIKQFNAIARKWKLLLEIAKSTV